MRYKNVNRYIRARKRKQFYVGNSIQIAHIGPSPQQCTHPKNISNGARFSNRYLQRKKVYGGFRVYKKEERK